MTSIIELRTYLEKVAKLLNANTVTGKIECFAISAIIANVLGYPNASIIGSFIPFNGKFGIFIPIKNKSTKAKKNVGTLIPSKENTVQKLSKDSFNNVVLTGLKACGYIDKQEIERMFVNSCDFK